MAGQVDWQPFFLNTDTPEEGEDLKEHITKKYGAEMARRFSGPDNPLAVAGQKVGISFNPARRVIPTGRCHVVMEHVNQTRGIEKGNDLMKVLFKMYAHSPPLGLHYRPRAPPQRPDVRFQVLRRGPLR